MSSVAKKTSKRNFKSFSWALFFMALLLFHELGQGAGQPVTTLLRAEAAYIWRDQTG
jgi:hypothetical protein